MTPLHLAAASGCIKMVKKYLVEQEADINIQSDNGVIILVIPYGRKIRREFNLADRSLIPFGGF